MDTALPLLVFTDLDGTLIEHENYSWQPALPALEALRNIGAGIVLASSKTAPELITLRKDLALEAWPAIVENGAGLLPPHTGTREKSDHYTRLRGALAKIPAPLRAQFRGFGDMAAPEIADITGLPVKDAACAAKRAFSEPGLWSGTHSQRDEFLAALATYHITAREGGRFLTLSFGATKADRIADITARYKPRCTVALGDAPNDVEMLQATDFGVIVANPHRDPLPKLQGEQTGRITRTDLAGPKGWNRAVLDLLERLNIE